MADQQTPDLTYVNSSNGKIYVNGIILDDCYDIQYTYKEMKEPIYGYNSKYFDAIVAGSVIIHGSFTINYKHDGYLKAILSMGTTDLSGAESLINDYKDFNRKYREALIEYRTLKPKIQEAEDNAKAQQLKADQLVVKVQDTIANKNADIAAADHTVEVANRLKDNAANSISVEDKDDLDAKVSQYDAQAKSGADQAVRDKIKIDEANSMLSDAMTQMTQLKDKISQQEIRRTESQHLIDTLPALITAGEVDSGSSNDKINDAKTALLDVDYKIKELEKEVDALQELIDKQKDSVNEARDAYSNNAEKTQDEMAGMISRTPAIEDAVKTRDALKAAQAQQEAIKEAATQEIDNANCEIVSQNEIVAKAKQDVLDGNAAKNIALGKITTLKMALDKITPNWNALKDQSAVNSSPYDRAEDEKPFNIFINYNGMTHKIIEDCVLSGHSHVVQQGGEAIKEYFSFIGKRIR